MNTKKIPAITTLSAGLVTVIMINVREFRMTLNSALATLLIVLLSFYIIGVIIKAIADASISRIEAKEQNEKELLQETALHEEQNEQEAK